MNHSRSNHYTLLSILLILIMAGIALAPAFSAQAQEPVHILMIHSYDPGYSWELQMIQGVLDGFAESGYSEESGNLVLDHFWMDTKRNNTPEYLEDIAVEATQYIHDTQPDLVIASGDNAVRIVVKNWEDSELPLVFTGLTGLPKNYGLPDMPNVTGVIERAHIEETLAWIHYVLPEATQITVLADDSFTTSTYAKLLQMALDGSEVFHGSRMYTTNSFLEWQSIIVDAVQDSDVLLIGTYGTLRDLGDNPMDQRAIMSWTVNISRVPVVSIWDFGVADGALGGSVIYSLTQGHEAALIAAQILGGTPPSEIPYRVPPRGKLTLNMEAVERWNVQVPLSLLEISEAFSLDASQNTGDRP